MPHKYLKTDYNQINQLPVKMGLYEMSGVYAAQICVWGTK